MIQLSDLTKTFGDAMEMTSSDDGQLYGYMLDGSGIGGQMEDLEQPRAVPHLVKQGEGTVLSGERRSHHGRRLHDEWGYS